MTEQEGWTSQNPLENARSTDDAQLGDITPEEFRRMGHRLIDWVADYLADNRNYPVFPASCEPGHVRAALPSRPPEEEEKFDRILQDFEQIVLPAVTHWNHPRFFGYFSISGSGPGVLGELLAAALNVNAMLWRTCPAATELEEVVCGWVRQLLGLPPDFFGIIYDTASVSTFHGLAAARHFVLGPAEGSRGLWASPGRLMIYASEEAHSSVDKAVLALGLGLDSLRKVPTDEEFRMRPDALQELIAEDRRNGHLPCAVVATVGTTSTTSVDPVPALADICRREGVWLHVDAAYGGAAAILPEMRWVLEGCEQADSLVFNPHKWLFTPIDCSLFYCRRPKVLKDAFSLVPEYLRSDEATENLMDYGIQLGRRFRALKLWFVLRRFGRRGLQERLRHHIACARWLARQIAEHPLFETAAPVPFSTVCFRALPPENRGNGETVDTFNETLLNEVNRTGRIFLSHTRLRGRFTLRWAVGNIRTTRQDVEESWRLLTQIAENLKKP